MQFNLGHKKTMLWVWIASMVYIALNTLFIALEWFYMPLLPVVILFALIAFTRMDLLLYLIVFFTPFSLQLSHLVEGLPIDMNLPTEPLLAAVLLLFGLKFLSGERLDLKVMRHPVTLAVMFQVVWMAMTVLTSSDPLVSLKFVVSKLWFVLGFYFLGLLVFRKLNNMHRYMWSYVISFSIIVAYTLIRHSVHGLNNQMMAHSMMQPFYKDHTSYGATLAFVLPVLITMFFLIKKEFVNARSLMILLLSFFGLATLFSYTRAAWVSLVGAMGIWAVIKLRIRFEVLFLGAAIAIGVLFVFLPMVMMELESNNQKSSGDLAEHVQSITNISNDQSNLERINRWSCALRMWKDRPVFGFGPGTYQFEYGRYQRSYEETEISTSFGTLGTAHSEYLLGLSESGLLGMLSFLLVIIATSITAVRVHLKSKSRHVRILSLGVYIGLTTYYIHGILNNFLDTDKSSALFWGYTAMLVAMDIYHKDKTDEELEAGKLSPDNGDIVEN